MKQFVLFVLSCLLFGCVSESKVATETQKHDMIKEERNLYIDAQQESNHKEDSVLQKFSQVFKDSSWKIYVSEIDTINKKSIKQYFKFNSLNDSTIKCFESYSKCISVKKSFCKSTSKNSYTEYKNCLQTIEFVNAFDTTYEKDFVRKNVIKFVNFSEVKPVLISYTDTASIIRVDVKKSVVCVIVYKYSNQKFTRIKVENDPLNLFNCDDKFIFKPGSIFNDDKDPLHLRGVVY